MSEVRVNILAMIALFRHLLGWIVSVFRSREDLILENLALRQQLLALHARRPRRRLTSLQKLFWVALRRFWARWKEPLILVTPKTVVYWHRAGFRIVQQLREALPYTPVHRFLLLDRDAKFGDDVVTSAKEMGSEPSLSAYV